MPAMTRIKAALGSGVLLLIASPLTLATAADAARVKASDETCFGQVPTHFGAVGQTVTGTSGDDVILGGSYVMAGAGDDLVCGASYVLGGPGNDHILMVNGGTAFGEEGDDEIVSIVTSKTATPAVLDGGPGNDTFYGGPLGETFIGGPGDDVVRGGGGRDRIKLGPGNDKGYGGPGPDRLVGGQGDDYLDGGGGKDRANGGAGFDQCFAAERVTSCLPISTPIRR